MIRVVFVNVMDNLYCMFLVYLFIYGVMVGYMGFVFGLINGNYVYIFLEEVVQIKNEVNMSDFKWVWVCFVINQFDFEINFKG